MHFSFFSTKRPVEFPLLDLFNFFFFYVCLFSKCHCAESCLAGRAAAAAAAEDGLRHILPLFFFKPSNGVIVIRTFQRLF